MNDAGLTRESQMIVYVIPDGYGPEAGQTGVSFGVHRAAGRAAGVGDRPGPVRRDRETGPATRRPRLGPPPAGPVVDMRWVRRVRAEVDAEWTDYCMDPYSIFIRPLLDDVTEPATARFFHCRERVEHLAPLAETPTASINRRVEYHRAVLDLADAWHAADVNARSVGTGRMDPDTKRALSKARQLINRAVDERTTAGERENCRLRLIELLTGLAPIPRSLRQRVTAQLGSPSFGQLAG